MSYSMGYSLSQQEKEYRFRVFRYSDNGDSTLSFMVLGKELFCYGIEDEFRKVKIAGETRIPEETYRLGIHEETTSLTLNYQEKYDWFDKHIEILNIKGFDNVYIHIGNYDEDTAGCYLIGDKPNINTIEKGMIQSSTDTFKRFYKLIYPLLLMKKEVTIQFIDMDRRY